MSQTKTAIITGASSGIGLALAKAWNRKGILVQGIARNFSSKDNDGMMKTSIDLSNIQELPARLGGFRHAPDILVLNAGVGKFGGIEQFSYDQIQALVNTNLVSNLFLLKHFLPMMKHRGGGDIVLIGSESALNGARSGAVYCATKFAMRGLAQSLRADCSTSNIRVILINPGPVDSDFFDDLNFEPQEGDEFVIQPEDIANAIQNALAQPRNVVMEEINLQPMKRSFRKK